MRIWIKSIFEWMLLWMTFEKDCLELKVVFKGS